MRTLVDFWNAQVHTTPDRTALVFDGSRWTFFDLDEHAERVSQWLVGQGAGIERVVANRSPRSPEAIIGQLAVLKTGAAHLAISPADPADRVAAILRDAVPVVVLEADTVSRPPLPGRSTRRSPIRPDSAAYLTYTSGSTGTPKGVVVEQRGLANLFDEHRRWLFPRARSAAARTPLRVAHTVALSFDASWDPFLWMVGGHQLHLLSDEDRMSPSRLKALIADDGLDVVEVTPSMVEQLVASGLLDASEAPAMLLTGGEALGQGLWDEMRAAPSTLGVNLYGPTECTVFCTRAVIREHATPVIGHPIVNTDAVVVDASGIPVPDGEPGELMIGGVAVARGYRDPAEPNRTRFHTSHGGPRARRFRTGDQVRRLPGGALEFLGRIDDQIKIRGHRIEPGEVEAALLAHPRIRQAVVGARSRDGGDDLIAHVVTGQPPAPSPTELRAFVAQRVPAIMVPSQVVHVDQFPVTAHGKIDRSVLPVPTGDRSSAPPHGELESILASEFGDVLQTETVGRHDDFFQLGGHSLLAAVLEDRLRRRGITCPLADILARPTVAELAAFLTETHTKETGQ